MHMCKMEMSWAPIRTVEALHLEQSLQAAIRNDGYNAADRCLKSSDLLHMHLALAGKRRNYYYYYYHYCHCY